jgi:hypothetical protein
MLQRRFPGLTERHKHPNVTTVLNRLVDYGEARCSLDWTDTVFDNGLPTRRTEGSRITRQAAQAKSCRSPRKGNSLAGAEFNLDHARHQPHRRCN